MRRNTLNLPERFEKLLHADKGWRAAVDSAIEKFGQFISDRPPFFPDYTDHGWDHLEEVIDTAVSLIRDEAWEVKTKAGKKPLFTSADAAVLVLAVLLHDAAMHLTPDGFRALIVSNDVPIDGFGDRPWPELWANYLSEAKRWDDRTNRNVYGDLSPVHPDELDLNNLTESALRLIGEFIRRHHPRLAHEFAVRGLLGASENTPKLQGKAANLSDLIGLIARSHGLPLRACLPYLDERYGLRSYQEVHAPFLMSLLRVADALQIHADRAPGHREDLQKLRSPLSQREWRTHQSVRDISRETDDPEAIVVSADPPSARTFLNLKGWLEGIQRELDASWAVLGEVYGRFGKEGLDRLGFPLRRVLSNLDDVAKFAEKAPYVPVRAAFSTATPELLGLLVGPLYGDRPEIGIRELIQNAVDAVRERHAREGVSEADLDPDREPDVVVSIDDDSDGSHWVTVRDRGIGMKADTITDYFLRAGASFRKSDEWRKQFIDGHDQSKVLRIGRFGVGALAAFLLGRYLEVWTRHLDEPDDRGIRFNAELDADILELCHEPLPIGTTIRVRIEAELAQALRGYHIYWDWYGLAYPMVQRLLGAASDPLPRSWEIPAAHGELTGSWRRLNFERFEDVHWSTGDAPMLTVNGIEVIDSVQNAGYPAYPGSFPHGIEWNRGEWGWELAHPRVSVFDGGEPFPINLQRTWYRGVKLPFDEQLSREVFRDLLARALHLAPAGPLASVPTAYYHPQPHGFTTSRIRPDFRPAPWFCTRVGSFYVDPWTIGLQRLKTVLVLPHLWRRYGSLFLTVSGLADADAQFGLVEHGASDLGRWLDVCSSAIENQRGLLSALLGHVVGCRVVCIHTQEAPTDIPNARFDLEWQHGDWSCLRSGFCGPIVLPHDHEGLRNCHAAWRPSGMVFTQVFVGENPPATCESPLAQAWAREIGPRPIPFAMEDRRRELAHAFESLAPYIKAHQREMEGK